MKNAISRGDDPALEHAMDIAEINHLTFFQVIGTKERVFFAVPIINRADH